jgi:hypothetical protein
LASVLQVEPLLNQALTEFIHLLQRALILFLQMLRVLLSSWLLVAEVGEVVTTAVVVERAGLFG